MMWNKAKVETLLRDNDRADEHAIVAIYDRQTQDEKASSNTKHNNARGFHANHASRGSYYARWVLGGRRLTGHHLDSARKIALHYRKQLAEIANALEADKAKIANAFDLQVTCESRDVAGIVVHNVMAGKCPDGCCGSEG